LKQRSRQPAMRPKMLIVLDTNVLVSGLLKKNSKPAKILDLVTDGKIQVAVDQRILSEYRQVLARPKLKITATNARAVLVYISIAGLSVSAPPLDLQDVVIQDLMDLPFAEVAVAVMAQAVVTGNTKHFLFLTGLGIEVLTPNEFLVKYELT
jgi:putative PIN family toxin of toxin-antitoxin system